ncbi:hypothetical protein Tco_0046867 [Tanacetum coccineum]
MGLVPLGVFNFGRMAKHPEFILTSSFSDHDVLEASRKRISGFFKDATFIMTIGSSPDVTSRGVGSQCATA